MGAFLLATRTAVYIAARVGEETCRAIACRIGRPVHNP